MNISQIQSLTQVTKSVEEKDCEIEPLIYLLRPENRQEKKVVLNKRNLKYV